MKIFLLFILGAVSLLAIDKLEFNNLYKEGKYQEACYQGTAILQANRRDEAFVQAYCFACLKSDYIDLISPALIYIKETKESRKNAAYFSSIVAMKKILYMSVVDGVDISGLEFPQMDHILSRVFSRYVQNDFKKENDKYLFTIDDVNSIIMFKRFHDGKDKLYIQAIKNGTMTKEHIYW